VREGASSPLPRLRCCGVRIDLHTPSSAASVVLESRAGSARSVHLCNAYTLSLAETDRDFRNVLNAGDLNLPDGMPLIWIARRLGVDVVRERVYGPDLMLDTFEVGQSEGLRHFLWGSTPEVMRRLTEELNRRFPDAIVVGTHAPPFRELTEQERAEATQSMLACEPDVVWVGLGTPRQDWFSFEMKNAVPATFVCVGAAFEFIAGTRRQAPHWMQSRGLEWLFRVVTEPRRLWKRYVFGNSRFVFAILRDRPTLIEGS
jgi:N-acetylglucosaminyldiphosphoundecaprenol N-acetyl-beta-D-mannosaminyltransferase